MATARDRSALRDWAAQSGLVFRGTVRRENAATMAMVPLDAGTAVVLVDEVLKAPQALSAIAGREITLLPAEGSSAKAGQSAVFFTRSWLYGESLAVIEVGRLEPAVQLDEVRALVDEAQSGLADEQFLDRLRRAELVVTGTVMETRPWQPGRPGPVSEHDPEWWEAVLQVDSVEKGSPPSGPLTVIFSPSTDEFWIDSPKLVPGQQGVFVLQRDQEEKGFPALRASGLTALHPLDVQPRQAVERVRTMLGRLG
jgi:hypothetical protein